MSVTHYDVQAADPIVDRERILDSWAQSAFSQEAGESASRYDWFYLENPQGRARAYFLTDGVSDRPVGFLGIAARRIVVDGSEVDAGILVDFVVHSAHRTVLPALTLQRKGRADALSTAAVVFGIPNEKSRAVCLRAGRDVELDITEYCRVVRSAKYLERRLPPSVARVVAATLDRLSLLSVKIRLLLRKERREWSQEFGEEFDELWHRYEKAGRSIGVRDASFLRWRFSMHPTHSFRTLTIRARGSRALLGYFVCEMGSDSLVVKDWLWTGTRAGLTRALLLLTETAYEEGACVVRIQTTSPPGVAKALRKAQFLARYHRTFVAVVTESLKEVAGATHWHITSADEDV